jgi:hypothetical protein
MTKSHVFDGIYILRDATHAVEVKCILVSKWHQKEYNVSDKFAAYIIRIVQDMWTTMKTERASSSETLVSTYQSTRRSTSEERYVHQHHRNSLKPSIII